MGRRDEAPRSKAVRYSAKGNKDIKRVILAISNQNATASLNMRPNLDILIYIKLKKS